MNGITLIALVITIIVLLILAGISIATLTGENGLLTKADTAKTETSKASAKEKVQIAVMGSYDNKGEIDNNALKTNLENVEGIDKTTIPATITDSSFSITVKVDGYEVIIEKDGEVAVKGENLNPPTVSSEVEEAIKKGQVLDENNPTTIKDKYENEVKIPAGFKIATDSGTDVTKGIVIEDVSAGNETTKGSQFVWIPLGEVKYENGSKTIELNRYTFSDTGVPTGQGTNTISSYYQELATSNYGNATANDIEGFKTSANSNHGYYIGRYEAGDPSATTNRTSSSSQDNPMVCKEDQYVYNNITQIKAAAVSREMYYNKKIKSDLINSYAWDTAIVFIQEFSGDTDYARQIRLQSSLAKTGKATDGTNKDVRCNIYDMAGNCFEWSTETSTGSSYPCVSRGGHYYYTDNYTSRRHSYGTSHANDGYSFRTTLYW